MAYEDAAYSHHLLIFQVPLICLNLLYSVVLITLPFIPPIPTAGKYLYAVWVILIYLCVAGNFIMLPLGISRAFGHKFFAANYGLVFSAFVRYMNYINKL